MKAKFKGDESVIVNNFRVIQYCVENQFLSYFLFFFLSFPKETREFHIENVAFTESNYLYEKGKKNKLQEFLERTMMKHIMIGYE